MEMRLLVMVVSILFSVSVFSDDERLYIEWKLVKEEKVKRPPIDECWMKTEEGIVGRQLNLTGTSRTIGPEEWPKSSMCFLTSHHEGKFRITGEDWQWVRLSAELRGHHIIDAQHSLGNTASSILLSFSGGDEHRGMMKDIFAEADRAAQAGDINGLAPVLKKAKRAVFLRKQIEGKKKHVSVNETGTMRRCLKPGRYGITVVWHLASKMDSSSRKESAEAFYPSSSFITARHEGICEK